MSKIHSKYSMRMRNSMRDRIYQKRLEIIYKTNFNYELNKRRYMYFMNAWLNYVLS